jgi:rubrerythrin
VTIFEHAKKFEKDSELFYRDLAERCFEIGVAVILTRLADEELKHYGAIEAMEHGAIPELQDSGILPDARNVIDLMLEKDGIFREDLPESEVYALALDIEERGREFYEERAASAETGGQKEVFLKLAQQEHEHFMTIEMMSDLFSARSVD